MRILAVVALVLALCGPLLAAGAPPVPPLVQRYLKAIHWESEDFPDKSFNVLKMDYPYPDFRDPKDYVSMNVMKAYGQERPVMFVVTLGKRVDPQRKLSLYFFQQWADGKFTPLDNISGVAPADVDKHFLGFVFKGMSYKGVDIFRHFMNGDVVIAHFFDKDGTENKVMMAYPSHIFRRSYEKLK